jgi:anti-sigma regulatory factor (Ser/Thr protein kinase)
MTGTALQMATTDLRAALSRLAQSAADHGALIAACRAAVAAADRGDDDPLVYVRDLLGARGQLPPAGASPLLVLADARTALHMAGWPATRADGHVIGGCPPAARTAPAWPVHGARPVLEIADAVTRPGRSDPSPPHAAPCGCLSLPHAGATGGRGGMSGFTGCTMPALHDRPDPLAALGIPIGYWDQRVPPGLWRVALYEAVLDGSPQAAREARRWAGRILEGCPAADDLALMLSELTANSAVHSRSAGRPGSIRARLVIAPRRWLRAEVLDDGPAGANPGDTITPGESRPLHDNALAESGRGLDVVAALAAASGRDGATAWLLMPWQPAPAAVPAPRARASATAVKESA